MRVGFVGVGRLGTPMALRVLAAGFPFTVWARRPSSLEPFGGTRARVATNLVELGAASDVVCLCVTDEPDVLEVCKGGLLHGMSEGSVLILHSTMRPEGCRRVAALADRYKVGVLDAPLCGGPTSAAAGTLPIPVGGDEALLQRCRPLLEAYGGLIRHCGALGSGQQVKLLFNLLYAANVEIVHDAMLVGSECGIESEVLTEFFTDFPYRGFVGGRLGTGLESPEHVQNTHRMLHKDVTNALQLLEARGASGGRIGPLARASLETLQSMGRADRGLERTGGVREVACRACGGRSGDLVLDLGDQPPCDHFPRAGDPQPDPAYPLQMWLCSACGLAQLVGDPTVPEEPRGVEPAALVAQARDAIERLASDGLLSKGASVAEYGSPHGGSWRELLEDRGLVPVGAGQPADLVLDCFGMMHGADQSAALAERVSRVTPGGHLLLQYHSLQAIVRLGQWNALRHGHYAYYSTTALTSMLAAEGWSPRRVWQFELYGGTVLMAAGRNADARCEPHASVQSVLTAEARAGVRDPTVLNGLKDRAHASARTLHDWLVTERRAGRSVIGYGAASRATALLVSAGVDRELLPAVADASPAKQGCRMPGTDIPIVEPSRLAAARPESVLLFLPELLAEVRAALPGVEACGGKWVDIEALGA